MTTPPLDLAGLRKLAEEIVRPKTEADLYAAMALPEDEVPHNDGILARGVLALLARLEAAEAGKAALETRQQELLQTIRRLSAETPYPEESTNAATLIAQVGTLRAQAAEAERVSAARISALEAGLVEAIGHYRDAADDAGPWRQCDKDGSIDRLVALAGIKPYEPPTP